MTARATAALLAFLAGPILSATAHGPGFSDDFATDPHKAYQISGAVVWQRGAVTLDGGGRLVRKLALGHTARARAVVRWPAGEARGDVRLQLSDDDEAAAVSLRRDEGRVSLVNLRGPLRTADLGAAGAAPWVVVLELGWGLARGKAWPEGTPEPQGWQTVAYTGATTWAPAEASLQASLNAGGVALAWGVQSDVPLSLTPARREEAARAAALLRRAIELHDGPRAEAAVAPGREALALYHKTLPTHHPDVAAALGSLGRFLQTQGRLDDAARACEESVALRRAALPAEHPELAFGLLNLGGALRALGRFDESRARLEEALAILRAALPPTDRELAQALNDLGRVLHDLGRPEEARRHYEAAIAVWRLRGRDEAHPSFATVLDNLGALLHDLGRTDDALALCQQALAVRARVLPKGHPALALSLNNIAIVLLEAGRPAEARDWLRRAVTAVEAAYPEGHPTRAAALHNLGAACRAAGRADEARGLLERALALEEKALPAGHPALATSLNSLGVLWLDLGRADRARPYLERALAARRLALPPNHPELLLTLNDLGHALANLGEADGAWARLLEATRGWAAHARRVSAGSAQRDHAGLLDGGRHHLSSLLAAADREPSPAAARLDELLSAVHDSKAVSAAALTRRLEAVAVGGDPEAAALLSRLGAARRQSANVLLLGPGERPAPEHVALCRQLADAEDRLERELAGRVAPFAELLRADKAGADRLAGRLAPGSALIELVQYRPPRTAREGAGPPGAGRYVALVLARPAEGAGRAPARQVAGPALVRLGAAAPIDAALRDWRAAVQRGDAAGAAARALHDRVWAPLARAVPAGVHTLYVAPDGGLCLLPLEALRRPDGSYLVEHFRISYLSSGRDLLAPAAAAGGRDKGAALIVADPAFDAAGAPGVKAGGAAARPAGPAAPFRPLPGFAREADAVARLLAARPGWEVAAPRGERATEEALLKASRPRLLYLITHGFFLAPSPPAGRTPPLRDLMLVDAGRPRLPNFGADPRLRSGVALAGANKWQERSAKGLSDGLLTALEVEGLDLWGTELVVLSACETGLGEVQVGEGVLGLRRAFQLAGAQTVLASLWKVPDTETERLMTDTLSRWLKGAPPHEALREAQLAMIRHLRQAGARNGKQGEAPPLYWAGFVCHGQPR